MDTNFDRNGTGSPQLIISENHFFQFSSLYFFIKVILYLDLEFLYRNGKKKIFHFLSNMHLSITSQVMLALYVKWCSVLCIETW